MGLHGYFMRTGQMQPREFLHVIGQMTLMLGQAQNNLRTLEQHLQAALGTTPEA